MCRLQHFISDLWKQGGMCEPHHNLSFAHSATPWSPRGQQIPANEPMSEGELVLGRRRTEPATVRIAGCSATARPACLHCVASKLRKKASGQRFRARLNEGARRPNLSSRLLQQSPPGLDGLTTTRMNGTELA